MRVLSVSKTMDEYRRKYYKVYHTTVVPILKRFEVNRKSLIMNTALTCGILLVVALGVFIDWCTGKMFEHNVFFVFIELIAGIASVVFMVWLPFRNNDKFVDELKATCMEKLLGLFGNVQWFDRTELITDNELRLSNLFSRFNNRKAYDAFTGAYGGVDFQISETEMYNITGSGKNRRVEKVFKGVIIKFKSNKNTAGNTIVATRGDNKIRNRGIGAAAGAFGLLQVVPDIFKSGFNFTSLIALVAIGLVVFGIIWIMNKFSKQDNGLVLNEIKLEDPEFSKKYVAYSTDQVEGRYLITSAFMERFQNLQTSFGTNKAKCSFYEDNLMIAISTEKNLFEIGNMFRDLEDPRQMESFFNELTSIFLMVEFLKLNEKTGL